MCPQSPSHVQNILETKTQSQGVKCWCEIARSIKMLADKCVQCRPGLLPLHTEELEGRRRSLEISGWPAEPSYDAREVEVSSRGTWLH